MAKGQAKAQDKLCEWKVEMKLTHKTHVHLLDAYLNYSLPSEIFSRLAGCKGTSDPVPKQAPAFAQMNDGRRGAAVGTDRLLSPSCCSPRALPMLTGSCCPLEDLPRVLPAPCFKRQQLRQQNSQEGAWSQERKRLCTSAVVLAAEPCPLGHWAASRPMSPMN